MSRPWDGSREFWWFSLSTCAGRFMGMFLRQQDLNAWVDLRPERRYRVGLWRGDRLLTEFLVWSRPAWARAPNETPNWRRKSRARRRKGGGDDGGIV